MLEKVETFPFLSEDTRYFISCLITQKFSKGISLEHILAVFQLQHLKESVFCVGLPDSVFHFTSIKALSCLSKSDSKLRLTNSAFLNDPSEGLVARKHLKDYAKQHSGSSCSSLINKFLSSDLDTIPISNTYIASFNQTLDNTSLPMWYQYGDKGSGCSIEFITKNFSAPIILSTKRHGPFHPFYGFCFWNAFQRIKRRLFKWAFIPWKLCFILSCANNLSFQGRLLRLRERDPCNHIMWPAKCKHRIWHSHGWVFSKILLWNRLPNSVCYFWPKSAECRAAYCGLCQPRPKMQV